jgi:hypothetical protein
MVMTREKQREAVRILLFIILAVVSFAAALLV